MKQVFASRFFFRRDPVYFQREMLRQESTTTANFVSLLLCTAMVFLVTKCELDDWL